GGAPCAAGGAPAGGAWGGAPCAPTRAATTPIVSAAAIANVVVLRILTPRKKGRFFFRRTPPQDRSPDSDTVFRIAVHLVPGIHAERHIERVEIAHGPVRAV